jgi:hypothetical protein
MIKMQICRVLHKVAANVRALPKCRKSVILPLGSAVNFIFYGAILKYNRNPKAESICFVAGILAMQCWWQFLYFPHGRVAKDF